MKSKRIVSLFMLILGVLGVFSFTSCKKKAEKPIEWNLDDGRIVILYGYGYNDEDFVGKSLANLREKYSVMDKDSEDGLILYFVFPDDFYVSGTSLTRISYLGSYMEDVNCKALITLGAPEFTHRSLAKIRDKDSSSQCYIISLFSQDDVLSTEAESDIVIDFVEQEKEKSEGEIDVSEEASMQHIEKTHYILEQTVNAVAGKNVFKENGVQEELLTLYGSEWEVGSYVDSSTGLKSRNHFVLKNIEKPAIPDKKKKGIFGK